MLPSPPSLSSSQVSEGGGEPRQLTVVCVGTVTVPVRLSALERPVRHLSGDSSQPQLQHQPPAFSRSGRHQSGEQVRTLQCRGQLSLPVQMGAARRASGDSSLQRFSLSGPAGEQLQLQPGTFTVVSQDSSGGQTVVRTSAGTQVVR